jgi:hypothetical protein
MKAVIFDNTPGSQGFVNFGVMPHLTLQNDAYFKLLDSWFFCSRERRILTSLFF